MIHGKVEIECDEAPVSLELFDSIYTLEFLDEHCYEKISKNIVAKTEYNIDEDGDIKVEISVYKYKDLYFVTENGNIHGISDDAKEALNFAEILHLALAGNEFERVMEMLSGNEEEKRLALYEGKQAVERIKRIRNAYNMLREQLATGT